MTTAQDLLHFWFSGPVTADQEVAWSENWFNASSEFDAELTARFAALTAQALNGALDQWRDAPETALALILLLDQMPRNLFRGSARAFSGDAKALELTWHMIHQGWEDYFAPLARMFIYMPLEHAEDLAAQEECVARLGTLGDPQLAEYGVQHRDIIAQFGRFPHRNAILGRQSTAEEITWLAEGGATFGQDSTEDEGAEKA